MKVVTAKEMQELDRRAIEEYQIPSLTLMENAGAGVVKEIETAFGLLHPKTVAVVSGKGNNGGDGLVVARLLRQKGASVRVFLLSPPQEARGDTKANLKRYQASGGRPELLSSSSMELLRAALSQSDLIIDAMFGTGLSSPLTGTAARVIEMIQEIQQVRKPHVVPVIAVDIPSGIHADTGQVMGAAVQASLTVTFGLPKRGHLLFPGAAYTGKLKIVEIGIPKALIDQARVPVHLLSDRELACHVSPRPLDVHKGTFGHVVVIAGSTEKSGAAVLTSLSVLRVGAGIVTLATPKSVDVSLHSKPPEIMTLLLEETPEGTLSGNAFDSLMKFISDKTVLAIGPGLSTHPETAKLIRKLLLRATQPTVIDADGLNALVGHLDLLLKARAPFVLTPHPGEMGRLSGLSTRAVQRDRLGVARAFSQEYGVTLVLKGARTLIATPEGDLFINSTGNPGMATAGSGDVLTGMIAGLIAQQHEASLAARLGVYLHGLAGDLAAQDIGSIGLLAGDLISRTPRAIAALTSLNVPSPHWGEGKGEGECVLNDGS